MKDYDRLMELLEQSGLFRQQADTLRELEQQFGRDELVVSVVGQFKRGKSSLINALLGEPLLPVAITPLTAVVTEIRTSREPKARVCFRSGTDCEISAGELGRYCGEKENPHNQKGVQTVQLWTPRQPFGAGTVLVDTPGVGSTNQDNTRETMDYLIHSDAVVFVLSVDSPINETEQQFLREIRQYSPNLWIVVNKADMADEGELEEFLAYCRAILEQELKGPVSIQPVSAKTGAGVEELKCRLQEELRAHRGQLRQASARKKLDLILRQLQALLSVAERAAAEPPEELSAKRRRFADQKRTLTAYGETLHVLAGHHAEKLTSEIGEELRGQLGELSRGLERRGEELAQSLAGLSLAEFKSSYQEQLEQYLRAQLEQLNERGMAQLQTGFGEVTAMLRAHADQTEAALARSLWEEFQVEYPLAEEEFAVSEQEDFYLHVDLQRMPRLYMELKDRLTSRALAQASFLKRCRHYAEETMECNVNNMLYNYRYKMQESLRPLCRRLEERISRAGGEWERLIALLDIQLQSAEQERAEKAKLLSEIRAAVEALCSAQTD